MTPIQCDAFLLEASRQIGSPYVWGGRGSLVFDQKQKRLVAHGFGQNVFDCSGLVTHCHWVATGLDWRGSESAQTLFNKLPKSARGIELEFYGKAVDKVTHVAIWLHDGFAAGPLVIEAHGGDQTTTSPSEAMARGAKVEFHQSGRRDLVGVRFL